MTRPLSDFALNNLEEQPSENTKEPTIETTNIATIPENIHNETVSLDLSSIDPLEVSLSLQANQANQGMQKTQQEHFRLIAENINDLVCMHDATGKLLYVASSSKELLDYNNDELINKYPEQFVHPNDLSKVHSALNVFIENQAGHTSKDKNKPTMSFQFRAVHKNGHFIWLDCQIQGIFDKAGTLVALISTSKDISKSHITEKQLRYHATHDLLTGLNNRHLFKERLSQTLEELSAESRNGASENSNKQIAVLHVDIDRFKLINESLGHQIGDKLLQAIAHRIRNEVHADDLVARLGSDEFSILLFDVESQDDATRVAERIQEKLQQAFKVNKQNIFVTASIGVVFSMTNSQDEHDSSENPGAQESKIQSPKSINKNIAVNSSVYTSVDAMLGDAEISMYRSKTGGKARYTVFDKSVHTDTNAVRRLRLESDLRVAVSNDELFPLYHPILTLPSNKLTGFEVLLRWQHPEFGLISPVEFIPIAEETGLITEITLWLLEKACHELVIWQDKTGFDLNLSINLSPRMFSIPGIDSELSKIIEQFPINPQSINLEITEGLLMEDMEYGAELLNRLRSRGIRTHIDDFGTGYCSLSYLHTLPIDALKIDKSFISGKGELHSGIVQTIINLAHNLDIPAIAEGIEDTHQLDILNTLKCDQAQGFLFSKPITVADVNTFLERHTSSGYIVGFEGLDKIEMPRQNINGT